uniref:Kringle domain-containing protein n=1 Tax=Alexandrium catenella TaxID=2925 RepID=A0A7S1RNE6_ALECA|mmetsp:Transcript_65478/g.174446  ORF Transcript_65478/g.174446 Transcript_65478/m.174446 type:complete len:254 (+) Transcript_65478:70-831(+)
MLPRSVFLVLVGSASSVLLRSPLSGATRDASNRTASDACECLAWKGVYAHGSTRCGAVFEMGWSPHACKRVFKRLKKNYCLNVNQTKNVGQWCYVSSACQQLNGGTEVYESPGINWKLCKAGEDPVSHMLGVDQLVNTATQSDIEISQLAQMFYPVLQDAYWEQAKAYFDAARNATDFSHFPPKLRGKLSETMASGRAVVFRSANRNTLPPYGVLKGTNLWEMSFSEGGGSTANGAMSLHRASLQLARNTSME